MILPLPAGYRRNEVLAFYGRDLQSVSEVVRPDGLTKCFWLNGRPEVLDIRFEASRAVCNLDHPVAARVLGLKGNAALFEDRFDSDPLLGPLISRQRGLRIPLTPDPWEALAWAIMGQQISVKVAVVLRRELILHAGTRHSSGLYAHPRPEDLADMDVATLRTLKFSRSKAEYLICAARAVVSGELRLADLDGGPSGVRGVGPWTVQYTMLRGSGAEDCLPAGDAGLAQGLARLCGERPSEAEIRKMMARFEPYRSFATYHVWASL